MSDVSDFGKKKDKKKMSKDPAKAALKTKEKTQKQVILMPFFMYSGAGRFMLTAENKRSIIKLA